MRFILDEMVPVSVCSMLERNGHEVQFIREYVPPGTEDPVVATASEQNDAILVSFDGDFEKIAPRVPKGSRRRFRKLSRIWLQCNEYQAAARLEGALSLIGLEFDLAQQRPDVRMHVWVSHGYIKTHR